MQLLETALETLTSGTVLLLHVDTALLQTVDLRALKRLRPGPTPAWFVTVLDYFNRMCCGKKSHVHVTWSCSLATRLL